MSDLLYSNTGNADHDMYNFPISFFLFYLYIFILLLITLRCKWSKRICCSCMKELVNY